MRTLAVLIAFAGALQAGLALAQRQPASDAAAQSYIMSAFLSQADPGVMAPQVALGPELEQMLGLRTGAPSAKVYEAVVPLTAEQRLEVRRATPAEIADYGKRRGLDAGAAAQRPLFTVLGGPVQLVVQYDLQALNIVYVGRLGVPDPDPRPVAAQAPPPAPAAAPKKPALVNIAWTAEFGYNSARLTPDAIARLEADVVPKLIASKEITYLHVYGHSDRLGSAGYNQRLSEKRAEAVRAFLVAKGVDADKIEVFAYGKTLPVKVCYDARKRSTLIECLAPNRRIVVEVQAAP